MVKRKTKRARGVPILIRPRGAGSDAVILVPNTGTLKIDADTLTVGTNTVYRPRDRIAGAAALELADVRTATPAGADYGIVAIIHPNSATLPVSLAAAVDVSDRDARLTGRVKNLDSAGAVIDPALKGQLPAALIGGRLDVVIGSPAIALDATLTGGTQKAIARGGAKGTTTAADITSNPFDANSQLLHVDGSKVTQPVSLATNTPDVTDRAARLLGVVYGSQAQQLKQTATNFNLQCEIAVGATLIDPRSIRALTVADVVGLGAGTAQIGLVKISDGTDTALVSTAGALLVEGATLTKGTQGTTGFSVQELKDAGRVNIMWTLEFSPAAVAEALMTMTESRDGAAVTTFTTKVVTNLKRLRITSWTMTVENTLGANPKRAKLRMKFNTAGAVTTASPLQANLIASASGTVNTVGTAAAVPFPDGVEYLGDGTKQIGFTLEFPDWVTGTQTGKVYVTISAFEY